MSDVHLPAVGNVPKKGIIIGVVGGGAVLAYTLYRHKSAAAAGMPAAGGAGVYGYSSYGYGGSSGYDPYAGSSYGYGGGSSASGSVTPYPAGSEYGYGQYGYGYYNPYTGTYEGTQPPGGVSGGGVASTPPATNPAWVAAVVPKLAKAGYKAPAAIGALARYTQGLSLNANQHAIVTAALALEGDPPEAGKNGHPPAIVTAPPSGQGKPPKGPKPTKTITANGHQDVFAIAHANGVTEGLVVAWNLNLAKYVGSKHPVPAGTRVKV